MTPTNTPLPDLSGLRKVAQHLQRTPNACIGKANRLGWAFSRPDEDRTVPKRAPRAGPSGICWNVWVPFDVEAKVKEYAKDAGMSVSGAMRELISFGLLSLEDDA